VDIFVVPSWVAPLKAVLRTPPLRVQLKPTCLPQNVLSADLTPLAEVPGRGDAARPGISVTVREVSICRETKGGTKAGNEGVEGVITLPRGGGGWGGAPPKGGRGKHGLGI